jgi:2,4-dienoyl-CoA reductase (NADPH2)
VESFRWLLQHSLEVARKANGADFRPLTVLQCAHSGRYSRPIDKPAPIIAHHDGLLDKVLNVPPDQPVISDDELDRLQDRYVEAARLAKEAGFDAVDIKSCHRYLLSELLAAHTRPGKYGGSFENRTRFLLSVVERIHAEAPGIMVTTRLNIYDGHPYPWGWGVSQENPKIENLRESLMLVKMLQERGLVLLNATAGNPYFTPQINRPYDIPIVGGKTPEEHPLEGVARIIHQARQTQQTAPEMVIIGSGYSWLRQFMGHAAAAAVKRGWVKMIGVGRGGFAYPDFARDLIQTGKLDPKKVCITCSKCTQIMRDHGPTGCVIRDREVYAPIYNEGREKEH